MRRRAALVVGVLGVLGSVTLTGCGTTSLDVVPPSDVQVDTPQLVAQKATTDIETCVPGTAPVGGSLPHLTLPCLGGGPSVDLATLRGPMILNVWYAGCGPCRVESPILGSFYRDHGASVPMLGIDFEDTQPAAALAKASHWGDDYPQVADPGGEIVGVGAFSHLRGTPYTVLIDAAGNVAWSVVGGVTSESELVDLVDEHLGTHL